MFWLLGYIGVGLFWLAVVLRLRSGWFLREYISDERQRLMYDSTYHFATPEQRKQSKAALEALGPPPLRFWSEDYDWGGGRVLLTLNAAFWPVSILFVVGSVIAGATINGINKKTRTRVELENELKKAKAEIDDLLRRDP